MCECPTMYDEKFVVARKIHHCCECGMVIAKGEKYQSVSGIWDGNFDRIQTCMPCVETRARATEGIKPGDCCDFPAFGELRQFLVDGGRDTSDLYAPIHARFLSARQSQEQRSTEPPK